MAATASASVIGWGNYLLTVTKGSPSYTDFVVQGGDVCEHTYGQSSLIPFYLNTYIPTYAVYNKGTVNGSYFQQQLEYAMGLENMYVEKKFYFEGMGDVYVPEFVESGYYTTGATVTYYSGNWTCTNMTQTSGSITKAPNSCSELTYIPSSSG